MTKIRTDDGAIGKSLKTTRTKVNDSDETVCEVRVQLGASRRQFEALAGLPSRFADHFYNEQGAPIADVELRFPKRELMVSGKLWRGEDQHLSQLPLKRATVDNLRFKLEPNATVFICRVKWRAAGDEIEDVKDLLGQWCSVDLTFDDPGEKQSPLELGEARVAVLQPELEDGEESGEGTDADDGLPPPPPPRDGDRAVRPLADRLAALGFTLPEEERFWFTISPGEMQKIHRYIDKREAGETANCPSILKPYKPEAA